MTASTAIGKRLGELKSSGCTVLVTGAVAPETLARVSKLWFGSEDCKRMLALTGGPVASIPETTYLPPTPEGDKWVCNLPSECRSAPAVASGERAGRRLRDVGAASSALFELWVETITAIGHFKESSVGGLNAGDVRVGIHSLRDLLHGHDSEWVAEFVRDIQQLMRLVSGIAHFGVCKNATGRQHETVRTLIDDGYIDIINRVRVTERGYTEERTEIPGVGETDWYRSSVASHD